MLQLKIARVEIEGMSLVFHDIVTDLKKSFVAAKLRHWKQQNR